MYDVVVIGAGVIGSMVARALSKYKLRLCIVESQNDVAMGATKANSAIVHAGFDAKVGSLKAKFNVRGCEMMEDVCRELGVEYKRNGSLVVAFNDEEMAVVNELYDRGIKNGVKELRIIYKDELKALEPNISDNVICALYAPTAGIVCPYSLAVAGIGNAMDNGADLRCNFNVTAIEKTEDGYKVMASEDDFIDTRYIVNCAGMYSDEIAKMVGDNSFNIHARRGEYILLDRDSGETVKQTIFRTPSKMGKGILVTPTVHGNILLGPTSFDISDKNDKDTTAVGFELILKNAHETVKSVPLNKTITSFCGLRSVGDTGDFIINSPVDNFINVAGIESPGLSSAPAIGEYIADMLKEKLDLEQKPGFNPIRESYFTFRHASMEEKNRMIKENPSYGKIICRCEGVTEGEIIDAIHRRPQPHDLDGIKRRTRAQMGRCQGGFCGPYIVELLAKELGIPFESVTKFGGQSLINVEKIKGGEQN